VTSGAGLVWTIHFGASRHHCDGSSNRSFSSYVVQGFVPRDIPTPLLARIQSGAWHPAILVKITTKEGVSEGYTSSQLPLVYDGLTYNHESTLSMSNLEVTLGTGVDNTQSKGSLVSGHIESGLVMIGKYRGARWSMYLCDFKHIEDGACVLSAGVVGDIRIGDLDFEIDHHGLSFLTKRVRATVAQKTCRCTRLGDVLCGLSMGGSVNGTAIHQTKAISAVVNQKKMTFGSVSASNVQVYTYGFVKFSTGANAGVERQVKSSLVTGGGVNVEVIEPFPYVIEIGDQARLEVGCNKKLRYEGDATEEPRFGNTCVEFGNGRKFRGEHFLPGNSSLQRTVNS